MIRQPSYQHQQQRGIMSMYPDTAPRSRLHRLVSDDEASSTNSTGSDPNEVNIHNNLYAQPSVVQNDIFRRDPQLQTRVMIVANNYHNQHQIYQQPHPSHPHHPTHRSLLNTPPKMRPGRGTCSKVKRTGNDRYCGLSAQISLEISDRTPMKTPVKTPGKTPIKGMIAPLNRDLFRAKTPAPMTDSNLMNIQLTASMADSKLMNIQLTQMASMGSSSDGGSSPRGFPFMPQQPTVAAKKKEPMSPKTHEARRLEIEEMMNEPAPMAIGYVTQRARDEKRKQELAMKVVNENPYKASVATQNFTDQQVNKAQEMEAIRAQVKDKEQIKPLPVDYFTKLGDAQKAAKAKSSCEFAESQMPIGIAYFTAKAKEDRLVRGAELRQLSDREMSVATQHFNRLAAEKEANTREKETETMPAAIQHFIVADRAKKGKKRVEIQEMHDSPPDMSPGQAYFKNPKVRKSFIGGLSARKKLKNCLTPPSKNFGSHVKHHQSRTSSTTQVTLSTSYNGVNDYRMTSTEHDPSLFQVELPTKKEIMVHSKVCALMDGYTDIHRDFNFAMVCGVSHSTLEKEYERSTDEKPMIAGSCHRGVVRKLLACASDIVVEGFFREYTDEENGKESDRMEACILSSESLRQIIVCFRGSTANQAKPLGKSSLFGKQASCILDEEQNVPILTTFRTAYFGTPLEKTVFALLANLETRKPFFDVVMTGHSFGAAMATIASLRYASSNSQMRVSCHVFGSPRIGGEEWRQLIHSVPNLRIYRGENGLDPYVLLPSGNEWIHCGHAIQMGDGSEFKARRFDRDRSSATSNNHNLLGFVQAKVGMAQGSSQGKVDHEIQSYDEKMSSSGDKWFTDFCEMKGKGIRANNEPRTLA